MNSKLNEEELNQIRDVSIHRVLNMANNTRRVSIRCPFHNDASPSLVLYPDNSYHCYGCCKHGRGAIDFVMGLGYSFTDAINELKQYV
jgi:DNA primase